MQIWCCGCNKKQNAQFVTGQHVYPHRLDLYKLGFWKCPVCGNFVGCHKGTFRPLGCIATPELKRARMSLHAYMDPLWRSGRIKRQKLYGIISRSLGYEYHTANTKSHEEIEQVRRIIQTHVKKIGG